MKRNRQYFEKRIYDNFKIVQESNQILGHFLPWKEKQQWNDFCENGRTINFDSTLGFLQKY